MEVTASSAAAAKLTVSLAVTGVRSDGYHLISAEMVSVDLFDYVSVVPSESSSVVIEDPTGRLALLEARFGSIPLDRDNIAIRALERCGAKGAVRIIKNIPFGAGLGGGSSDAAAVLRMLGRSDDLVLAGALGADVPFCLRGGRAFVGGIGEEIAPLDHCDESFVLFLVPIVISTADVYRCFDSVGPGPDPGRNHLLHAALVVSPELGSVKSMVERELGIELDLAGSGSTLFWRGTLNDLVSSKKLRDLGSGRVGYRWEGLDIEVVEVSALPAL